MRTNSRFWWGLALIATGVLFLLDSMDILSARYAIRNFWPLILVLWGAILLFGRSARKNPERGTSAPLADVGFGNRVEDAEGQTLKMGNVFGEIDVRVTSKEFRGGSASTVFGNVSVNLTDARPAPGEHTLKVDTVFGTIRVVLPPDMQASVVADAIVGGAAIHENRKDGFFPSLEWESTGYKAAAQKVRIDGSTILGSVAIIRAGG